MLPRYGKKPFCLILLARADKGLFFEPKVKISMNELGESPFALMHAMYEMLTNQFLKGISHLSVTFATLHTQTVVLCIDT